MSKIPRIPAKKALLVAIVLVVVVGGGAGFYLTQMNKDLPPPPPQPAPLPIAEAPLVADPMAAANAPAPVAPVLTSAAALPPFEAEKASGTLSFPTTRALADAYVAEQNAAAAVETYDAFLATHPDDVAAIDARAKLLQGLGREDDYKTALIRLAELDPTEARLADLSGYLNSKQLYAEQLAVLQKMSEMQQKKNPETLLAVADVAMAAKDTPAALQAFADYQALPNAAMNAAQANQYVALLAQAKREKEALAYALEWSKAHPDGANHAALARALLDHGAPAQAVSFIEAVTPEGTERSPELKKAYADAYVGLGEYAKALPLLKELRGSAVDGEYEEAYFVALANVAKKDNAVRDDLRALVKDQFASGKLTDAQKIDRVYALLNIGDKALATDYAERGMQASADDAKDKWAQLYKSLTAPAAKRVAAKSAATPSKKSKQAATVAAPSVASTKRMALATRAGTSDAFARTAAFAALKEGRRQEAVKLFAQLAIKNGPESADAKQLMYVLGTRVGQQEMAWLTSAAKQSSGDRRKGWIEIIANVAPAEGIVAVAQLNPDWRSVPAFEARYASALQQLGSAQGGGTQIVKADALVARAATAFAENRPAEGERLLASAAAEPDASRRTYLNIAELELRHGRYTQAAQSLQAFAGANSTTRSATDAAQENVELNYYLATLAHRNGDAAVARVDFSAAIAAAGDTTFDDRDTQVKLLAAQMARGNTAKASRGFEALLKQSPRDAGLLADYLSALLDQKQYDDARAAAYTYGSAIAAKGPAPHAPAAIAPASQGTLRVPATSLTAIQPMSGGKELKLQFDGPLPQGFKPDGVADNPTWLAYYTVSYDSMVIAASPGFNLQAESTDGAVTIAAVADAPVAAAAQTAAAERQQYLRLQLLYARLELESGETDQALNRLNALHDEFANAAEYKAYQASAEFYALNPKRSLSLVKDAQRLDPANQDIGKLRRNVERFHAEHFKLDHEWYKVGRARQNISTLEARAQYEDGYEVTARLQNNYITTGPIQRTQGAVRTFSGDKMRGEIEVSKAMDDSAVASASLFGNNDQAGGRLSYQFVNPLGTTQAYVEYHKPYWDMSEAVVGDAVRDRAGVTHYWRPDVDWLVHVDGAYNRYGVDAKQNIGDSVSGKAHVLYTLQALQPYVALGYSFDGEYLRGHVKRNGFTGQAFKYLPLRSREVHALTATFFEEFSEDTNGKFSVGYAIDRLGERGPVAEGQLTHYLEDDFDVQLRGRYGFDAQDARKDNTASLGGYAQWTW